MTTIHFTDGKSLECESVHSNREYYNGVNRDKLTFIFSEEVPISLIVETFTPDNTKRIYLEDEGGEKFLYEHYTIRLGAGVKERGSLLHMGEDADHKMVSYVEMIRTTYSEQQLEELSDTVDVMLIAQLMGGVENV